MQPENSSSQRWGRSKNLLQLAALVEQAVRSSSTALRDQDGEAAFMIAKHNALFRSCGPRTERSALTAIVEPQSRNRDLLDLNAVVRICLELGRVGDCANAVGTAAGRWGTAGTWRLLRELGYMARKTADMLLRTVYTLIVKDPAGAWLSLKEDDAIEALGQEIYFEALDHSITDPASKERLDLILWAAHDLEQLADYSAHLCQPQVFATALEWKDSSVYEVAASSLDR